MVALRFPARKTARTNYQKCIPGASGSDAISFHLRDITFRSPRNSISRTSRHRWLFNLLRWREKKKKKKEEEERKKKRRRMEAAEGSVLLGWWEGGGWTVREGWEERRQAAHESRHRVFHIPQGNYWQSARKWRRKYHVADPPESPLASSNLPILPGATFLRFLSCNPASPLFPSRLRLLTFFILISAILSLAFSDWFFLGMFFFYFFFFFIWINHPDVFSSDFVLF